MRGYNLPVARYLFLHFEDATRARNLIGPSASQGNDRPTLGQRKAASTLNIAFTHRGLAALDLPDATLLTFPVEFQQGMKKRAAILGDTGVNSPDHWDECWRTGQVHAWLGINAQSPEALDAGCADVMALLDETGGAIVLASQDAAAVVIDGKPTTREHFGFTDGFGNPDYLGVERSSQPGQGKLMPDGTWAPLATGELLLGYADEAGELPVAPVPHILASNGTFMVYRKLHQNLATFRAYLEEHAARLRRRQGEARRQIHRPLAETARPLNSPPTSPIPPSRRTPTAAPTSPSVPILKARAARSARIFDASIREMPSASMASSSIAAASPAAVSLWPLRRGRRACLRSGRSRRHLHGAQRKHLPAV